MTEAGGEFVARHPYFGFGKTEKETLKERMVASLRREIAPLRFNLAASAIIKETDIKPGDNVLELGCGVGLLGEAIKRKVNGSEVNYFGIDLNFDPALKQSQERGLAVIQADAVKLPFSDEAVDRIVSNDVFEHVDDAKSLAKEVSRVLKKGGKAFIVIADPSEGRFGFVQSHINRTGSGKDVQYWTDLFEEEGLTVLPSSEKYRKRDWRKIFSLPILRKIKDKPFFSCCFDIVSRPGVFILSK